MLMAIYYYDKKNTEMSNNPMASVVCGTYSTTSCEILSNLSTEDLTVSSCNSENVSTLTGVLSVSN